LNNFIWVGLGGIVGTFLRFSCMVLFPSGYVLWIVNIIGSFVLGFVACRMKNAKNECTLFLTTGLLGSFTTFATFSAEWLMLMQEDILLALFYGLGMTIACFLAVALGFKMGGYSK
jgi:CrcB protein